MPLKQATNCFLSPTPLLPAAVYFLVIGNCFLLAHSAYQNAKTLSVQILTINAQVNQNYQIKC